MTAISEQKRKIVVDESKLLGIRCIDEPKGVKVGGKPTDPADIKLGLKPGSLKLGVKVGLKPI